jgi:RimJ/RimL family protein N-acetyltransferase
MSQLVTSRLLLRQWRQADLDLFAALNADPEVMRYFLAALTREQSDQFAGHVQATIDRQGWLQPTTFTRAETVRPGPRS